MTTKTFAAAGYTLTDHTLPSATLTICNDVPGDFSLHFDNSPEGLRDLYELLQTDAAQQLIASAAPPAPALSS